MKCEKWPPARVWFSNISDDELWINLVLICVVHCVLFVCLEHLYKLLHGGHYFEYCCVELLMYFEVLSFFVENSQIEDFYKFKKTEFRIRPTLQISSKLLPGLEWNQYSYASTLGRGRNISEVLLEVVVLVKNKDQGRSQKTFDGGAWPWTYIHT